MLCCLVCLKGTPVPGSKLSAFYTNTDQFQIGVMESCWKNCPWCVFGYVCACCAQFIVRQRALDGNLDNYRCCQGHCRQCTDQGCCGVRKYPRLCLCLESFACICCAMKSNRMHLMDKFKLQPDPWDNRVIHLKECLYNTLGWICIVGDACFEGFGALLLILDLVADLFYIPGVGCMTAQMINEMQHRGSNAPAAATIVGR